MPLPDRNLIWACAQQRLTPSSWLPVWRLVALALALAGQKQVMADKGMPKLSPAQVRSLDIRTAKAEVVVGAWLSFPAEIVIPPSQQRVVAAPMAGLVEALAVSPGEAVKAGQWLVRLRSPHTQELQRDVLQTRSQFDLAQRQVARDEALYQEGLIPLTRLETSRAQLQQTKAQAQERQSALSTANGGQPVPDSQGMISLKAPLNGQVLEQLASVGQRVEAMAPIYRMASLYPLWVDIQVPIKEAIAIRPGDAVQLPGTGQTKPASARVVHLGAAVDQRSQTLTVRAQIQGHEHAWRPGQLVQAQIQQASQGGHALRMPAAALMPATDGQYDVFVARHAEQFERVRVEVLSRDGDQVTVTGLTPDAQVVVRGTAALKALLGS